MRLLVGFGSIASVAVTSYALYTLCIKKKPVLAMEYTFEKIAETSSIDKYKVYMGRDRLKYRHVIDLLKCDEKFRDSFITILKDAEHSAYFFETPAVNDLDYSSRDFEFVLVNSERLSHVKPDVGAFSKHFERKSANVAFHNLGKDAVLIAPCPSHGENVNMYAHLASFVRKSERSQVHDFWRLVAEEMNKRVISQGLKYTWLSTSGLGIYWLHMRIDSRPKYYTYQPYKTIRSDRKEN